MLQLSSASDAISQPTSRMRSDAQCASPSRICFPFGGGAVGGSHISATQLIRRLDRTRFNPLVVLHHGAGQFAEFLRAEGLDYVVLPHAGFFGNSCGVPRPKGAGALIGALADQWRLARFLRMHDVQIVHTNEGAMHVSWALPARLAGAKLLWHHRGSSDARGVRFLAPFAAHRIVGVSEYALSEVRRIKRTARKTAVVYSPFDADAQPIDKQQAHLALTSELEVDPGTRLIGFFGHMLERKRPLFFVEVLSCMAKARPDLSFMGLIFGSPLVTGMDVQVLHKAKSLGVAERLRLMGFRYPSAPLMAACDIHAVPAVHEPFGRSLIEAMLLGTPVVAAASGGNVEAIDHGITGLLCNPDDPAEMASAIIGLLDSPERLAAMATTALDDACQRYSAERHVEQISAIYRTLLPDKTGGEGRPW